jgi:hypothetical protein
MALLRSFDPPAFLSDYDGIPGQREAWHAFISRCFKLSIGSEAAQVKRAANTPGTVQFLQFGRLRLWWSSNRAGNRLERVPEGTAATLWAPSRLD